MALMKDVFNGMQEIVIVAMAATLDGVKVSPSHDNRWDSNIDNMRCEVMHVTGIDVGTEEGRKAIVEILAKHPQKLRYETHGIGKRTFFQLCRYLLETA